MAFKLYTNHPGIVGLDSTVERRHRVGEKVCGLWNDGSNEYPIKLCYVKAAVAMTKRLAYLLFNDAGDTFANVDTALTTAVVAAFAASGDTRPLGIPLNDIALNSYGWVATKGIFPAESAAQINTANTAIYTSATAGKLEDATTSTHKILDAIFTATNTTAEAVNIFAARDLVVAKG